MAVGKKTGGRQKGTPNKRSIALEEKVREAAEIIESTLPEAFKGDAHALLMTVYKDPTHPIALRIDAAKAAIAFEKPKLASVQHSGDAENPLENLQRVEIHVVDSQSERPTRVYTAPTTRPI